MQSCSGLVGYDMAQCAERDVMLSEGEEFELMKSVGALGKDTMS